MNLKHKLQLLLESDIQGATSIQDNVTAFAADALVRNCFKKLPVSSAKTREVAIREFVARNDSVQQFDISAVQGEHTRRVLYRAQGLIRELLRDAFYCPRPENGRFGPGSALHCAKTDQLSKYGSLTYTDPALLSFFLSAHPWSTPGHPNTHLVVRELALFVRRARRVRASKLTTVPKSDTIDRCIAVEPNLNMFLQQAIRVDLERVLRRIGIDLSIQPDIQRKLAREGSVVDSLSTIDLSAASDSISLGLVRFLFPPDWAYWLELARSPEYFVSGDTIGKRLNVFATMGNATTFPVQTLIFWALAKSTCLLSEARGPIGVFGDDIIIPKSAYHDLADVLSAAGFSMNMEKSFRSGSFKESCGEDYYLGDNVRSVYIQSLDSEADYYSAINRLGRWCARWGLPLPKTMGRLHRELRSRYGKPLRVPMFEDDTAGIHEYISGRYTALRIKSDSRPVPLAGDIELWLCVEGVVRTESSKPRIGLRPYAPRYWRERCFAPCPAVRDPTPLCSILAEFGLGSRLLR